MPSGQDLRIPLQVSRQGAVSKSCRQSPFFSFLRLAVALVPEISDEYVLLQLAPMFSGVAIARERWLRGGRTRPKWFLEHVDVMVSSGI
jgi:hypothetical protein